MCPLATGAARPHLHVPGATPPSSRKTLRQEMVNRGAERRTPPLASCLDRRSTCSEQTRNILLNPTPGGLALQLNRLPQDRDAILPSAPRPLVQTGLPLGAHSDDRSNHSGRGSASGAPRGPAAIEPMPSLPMVRRKGVWLQLDREGRGRLGASGTRVTARPCHPLGVSPYWGGLKARCECYVTDSDPTFLRELALGFRSLARSAANSIERDRLDDLAEECEQRAAAAKASLAHDQRQ